VVPTYSMYRIYMMAAGANVTSVPMGTDFSFPFDSLRGAVTERTRLIAMANPNNPTGTLASIDQLLVMARYAPRAAVLIDEAYFEFSGKSVLGERRGYANVFVARTFSKAYGLAGLRAGALIGDSDQMATVRRVSSPYNVNGVALACLPVALEDREFLQNYVSDILESRTRLQEALEATGVPYWPSEANFVLMRVGRAANEARLFIERMRARGILVRDRSADYGCEGCVRITLGPKKHTDKLLDALHATLEELKMAEGIPAR